MPMYDYECPECGLIEDIIVPSKDRDNVDCEKCGKSLYRIPTAAKVIGPTWSKPLNIPNMGLSFDSKKDADKHMVDNNIAFVDPKGNDFKKVYNRTRDKIEASVKKKGFKDVEDLRAKVKANKINKNKVAPS